MSFQQLMRRGDPAIWFTATGLGLSLLMIAAMVGLILFNGLGFFWPRPLVRVTLNDGTVLLGEVQTREGIPAPGTAEHLTKMRLQLKIGNRDLSGADFRWVDEAECPGTDPAGRCGLPRTPRVWPVHRHACPPARW